MKNIAWGTGIVLGAVVIVRILIPPLPMNLPQSQSLEVIYEPAVKVPHWVSNMPKHASTFAAPPVNVVISVDSGVTALSSIRIVANDIVYGADATIVDPDGRSIRQKMRSDAPDGKYAVAYRVCWTDSSCDNGSFQFAIDRRLAGTFEDHVGRADIPPDVGISIEPNSFAPKTIRIRKNTRVIWTNNDTVSHSITSEAMYYPTQNSPDLRPKQAYEVVFSEVGEYPYYSRTNPEVMIGSLLVEH